MKLQQWKVLNQIAKPTLEEATDWTRAKLGREDEIHVALVDAAVSKCTSHVRHFLLRADIEGEFKSSCVQLEGLHIDVTEVAVKSPTDTDFVVVTEPTITDIDFGVEIKVEDFVEGSTIRIRATTGIEDTHRDYSVVRQAILFMVSQWYNNRDDKVKQMPTVSENLLNPFKIYISR